MSSQENSVALPLRSHTILGVCEAVGEDFGFNPVFLRVPLAASVIINPLWAVGAYLALGAAVLLSRVLLPNARAAAVSTDTHVADPAKKEMSEAELPLAA